MASESTDRERESRILQSWNKNVAPWTGAIAGQQIESRTRVTNRAILDAVATVGGRTVLDIGCGEGWLSRALSDKGFTVTGIDAVAGFVASAQQQGGGQFLTLSYEQLSLSHLPSRFDVAVCNFSLLGRASVQHVFDVMPTVLNPGGYFIVQTLHPLQACGELPYEDGWRQGSWDGFSADFVDPAPWFFRTLSSWLALVTESGMTLAGMREPLHPDTGKPVSLIVVARQR